MKPIVKIASVVALGGLLSLRFVTLPTPTTYEDAAVDTIPGFYEHSIIHKTEETQKPRLVFHVGPGKMGSSSLQSGLQAAIHTLELDGWAVYPHTRLGALNRCLAHQHANCSTAMDHFLTFLHQQQPPRNIVLSTETWFSESTELTWYKNTFKSYNVTAVVAYRRYFHWLPSRYYQMYRFRCRPRSNNHANNNNNTNQEKPIPPLDEYLSHTAYDHPTLHKIKRVSKYFDDIQVVNIETTDFVQEFVCQILGAFKTCRRVQSTVDATRVNQGKTLAFDRLAQHLLIQNHSIDTATVHEMVTTRLGVKTAKHAFSDCAALSMLLEKFSKEHASSSTKQQQSNGLLFPLQCPPSHATDALLNISMEAERILFPDSFSSSAMMNDFAEKLDTTLFCDMDIESVLSDETWRPFLNELRGSP